MSELNQATRLVLVIDDDEAIRMAICDILQTVGIQVVMAAGGEDGLELYQQRRHEVDLILLDYSMPGLDGAETLCRLRKIDREVPVVISTGYSAVDLCQLEAFGAKHELLLKPYRMQDLIDVVTRHLDSTPDSLSHGEKAV